MVTYPADAPAAVVARYRAPLEEARRYEYCDKAAAAEGLPPIEVYAQIRGYVDVAHGLMTAPLRAPVDDDALTVVELQVSRDAGAGVLHPWLRRALPGVTGAVAAG